MTDAKEPAAIAALREVVHPTSVGTVPIVYADILQAWDTLTRERDEAREQREGAYRERNQVVAWASRLSIAAGYVVRVTKTAIDGWDVAWHNCAYVMTPTGQASWHFHDDDAPLFADLPHGEVVWDGHTTLEKYDRLHRARYALDALPQGDA